MSRPRPALSLDAVVDVALALADEEGLAAVSMRRIAADLDVVPMALYRHVANKDALLDAIVERLTVDLDRIRPSGRSWSRRLRSLLHQYRDLLRAHPSLTEVLATRPVLTEGSLHFRERVIAELLDAGLTGPALARAYSTVIGFTVGYTLLEAKGVPIHPSNDPDPATTRAVRDAAGAEYPGLQALLRGWTQRDDDEYFEWGLDAVLAGITPAASGHSPSR